MTSNSFSKGIAIKMSDWGVYSLFKVIGCNSAGRSSNAACGGLPTLVLVAALLAGGPVDADIEPGSECQNRQQHLFSTRFEALESVGLIGLQNCSTLDEHIDGNPYDAEPLIVPLQPDGFYHFALLSTAPTGSLTGAYAVSGLPAWGSFDSQYGVTTLSPPPGTEGEFLVEYNVVPTPGLPGSVNPLLVLYDLGTSSTLNFDGLDFEADGQVTSWPYHGTWGDSDDDGVIDQPVVVREGKGSPYEAWVLSDKPSVIVSARNPLPSYVSLDGNRIDFQPPDGHEGDNGVLELLVCDSASPSDCRDLDVPYQVVDRLPNIVGLSYFEQNGTIDNPVDGPLFEYDVEVPCTIPFFDSRYVVSRYYDVDQSYQIMNAGPGMGINGSTGGIGLNPDCQNVGAVYSPSVRVISNSGSSSYKTGDWVVTNGVNTANLRKYK